MKLSRQFSVWGALCLSLITSLPLYAITHEVTPLKPTRAQAITSIMVVKRLEQHHYNRIFLNDELASVVFDRYLEELDRNKSYFLASDIKEFEGYRFELDNALVSGNLAPAFYIFNRYQKRLVERLDYMLTMLEGGISKLKFDVDETYELDRSKASWMTSPEDMNSLWRKRLKHLVLNYKLSGKSTEEIEKTLTRRFTTQLNRTLQANNEDAFQLYLNSLTQTYDPHTQYFSPRVSENFNINMSLQLQGIGAVLQSEDEFTKVVRLVEGGPAYKSRLLSPADRIVGVGQEKGEIIDVVGWRLDEVVDRIRGEKGSTVRLEIIPHAAESESDTRIISLVRDTVKLEDRAAQSDILEIEEEGVKYRYGVIDVPTFYADFQGMQNGDPDYRSTTRDVAKLIAELKQKNIDGLIIDLRNNGGGSLQEANSLVGLFIETGPTVQVRSTTGKVEMYGDNDPRVMYDGPIAVIVNRLSASASEIFAGAIQDYQRGLVIGERTFGKGTVQSLQPLDQGQLKITLAKFYRISGESNQHKGILPDIHFPSLFDFDEIGESALDNALPSDTIRAASFSKEENITPKINFLRASHDERVKKNPDFVFLNEQISILQENRSKNIVSLSEKQRKAEKEALEQRRLNMENEKRASKKLPPLKSIDELKESDQEEEAPGMKAEKIELDYIITEVGNILKDMQSLSTTKARVAIH